MKVKYKDIKHDMFLNCAVALETAIKYYDGEIDKQFLNKIAETTVENFQEFYEIDMRKSVMVEDMRWYLKGKLFILEEQE